MAQDQQHQEREYQRELNARRDAVRQEKADSTPKQEPEKQSLFRSMGQGKLGRYGKAAIAAGTLAGAQPGGAKLSDDDRVADEMRKSQQQATTQQYQAPRQTQAESVFGKGASLAEQDTPNQQNTFGDDQNQSTAQPTGDLAYASKIPVPGGGRAPGEIAQAKPLTQEEQERFGNRNQGETEAEEDERFRRMGKNKEQNASKRQQSDSTTRSMGMGAAKGGALAGQALGKGTEVAGKGTELAGRGMQAGGRAMERGGQAMTRAGAQMSATGAGAIVGVPLAAAGLATTAVGAGVDAAGKGAEGIGRGMGRGGKAVGEVSGRAKDTLNQAEGLRKSSGAQATGPGEQYMDLARKLREEKAKALRGDITGVAKDVVNEVSQLATARALSWAWIALIPTFGLSIIYIDIHLVAHYFAGSPKFCAFGEEWMLRKVAAGQAAQVAKEATVVLERVELLGAVFVNVLLFILVSLSLLIGYIVLNPVEGLQLLF